MNLTDQVIGRFEEKFEEGEEGECWEWLAGSVSSGHGAFKIEGTQHGAHRVAYTLYCGESPGDQWVLHECGNPSCVNPGHLYLGGAEDNAADAARLGEYDPAAGEDHGNSVLARDDVVEIRGLCESTSRTQESIGEEFGIDHTTVSAIHRGERWGHVETMEGGD